MIRFVSADRVAKGHGEGEETKMVNQKEAQCIVVVSAWYTQHHDFAQKS